MTPSPRYCSAMVVGLALTMISVGQIATPLHLPDQLGHDHALLEAGRPTLVVHEDQEGGKQNQAIKALIAAYHDPVANRAKLTVWPVADLQKWAWWPAKGHALADVKKSAAKNNTQILVDWTGAVRKAWGLAKGKNSLVLIGADGKVVFASEGECSAAQKEALEQALRTLGLSLP